MDGLSLLRAQQITKQYGGAAVLRRVDVTLAPGTVLGVFGPNGSGKSTLLDILALAAKPDDGQLYVNGRDVAEAPAASRAIVGYAPQDIALFEELTVRDNLLAWSRLKGRQATEKLAALTDTLALQTLLRKRVAALSGGMKRRVNFAAALMGTPKIVVLDEPFAGVDVENAKRMTALIQSVADGGAAVVLSGHAPDALLPVLSHVLVLSGGEALFSGDKASYRRYLADTTAQPRASSLDGGVP